MIVRAGLVFLGLCWASSPSVVIAQDSDSLHFEMSVVSPAPVPGKPFTITWAGGSSDQPVYIMLNNYFPDTPDQDIKYGGYDILSNAPNNGSWTYNVPLNIHAGRHSFSIGINPFLWADTTEIFTILPSQTSHVASGPPAPVNTAFQTYNGCGLPPVPDYTYTGYQPPCTVTTNGHVETIYPIVPASKSSEFFSNLQGSTSASSSPPTSTTPVATGIYAQALQCPTKVVPSTTAITASGSTTILSLVACTTAASTSEQTANVGDGVCHSSGYTTFSVSGTSSVCCPGGWATTPLNEELFCFTSVGHEAKRTALREREDAVTTLAGLVFTSAGVVTRDASVGGSLTESAATETGSSPSPTTTTSGGTKELDLGLWWKVGVVSVISVLSYC